MDSKLKKCPFCGGEGKVGNLANGSCIIYCNHCNSRGSFCGNEKYAVAHWNKRVEQFTKEELEWLQNLLEIERTSEPICESIESKIKSLLESEAQ